MTNREKARLATRARIIAAGLALRREAPGEPVGVRAVGRAVGMPHQGICYHWRSASALNDAICAEAVRVQDAVILPVLVALRHPAAVSPA